MKEKDWNKSKTCRLNEIRVNQTKKEAREPSKFCIGASPALMPLPLSPAWETPLAGKDPWLQIPGCWLSVQGITIVFCCFLTLGEVSGFGVPLTSPQIGVSALSAALVLDSTKEWEGRSLSVTPGGNSCSLGRLPVRIKWTERCYEAVGSSGHISSRPSKIWLLVLQNNGVTTVDKHWADILTLETVIK